MRRRTHRKCPPGYMMKNGVCSSNIKSTQPFTGNSGNTREDCMYLCDSILRDIQDCFGLHNYPQGGCSFNFICGLNPEWALTQPCWACTPPSGAINQYNTCMHNCIETDCGHGGFGGSKHHGSGQNPPKCGMMRRVGKVRRRRR